jgi:hypothetical protein
MGIGKRRTRRAPPRCLRANCANRMDIGCHNARCCSRRRCWLRRA